jgi:hypothetical protein
MYEKYAGTTVHVCVLTHFLFCVFNLMLPACKPNFPEVVFATYKVEQGQYYNTHVQGISVCFWARLLALLADIFA